MTLLSLLGNASVQYISVITLLTIFILHIQEHRNLPFMRELRYLFALLVGSKRKYVDPSRAVEILKDAFKSNDSQQVISMYFQASLCMFLYGHIVIGNTYHGQQDFKMSTEKQLLINLTFSYYVISGYIYWKDLKKKPSRQQDYFI